MFKRRIALLLAVVLMLSMALAGCGKGGKQSGNDSDRENSEETTELLMVIPGANSSPASLPEVEEGISAITKEKINATVKVQILEWGAYQEQVNLMLAGSDKLDLLMCLQPVRNYQSKGQLLSMEDLVDEYAPDAKAVLGENLNACKLDGELYGLYSVHDLANSVGLCARKDILDELNVDRSSIKTWDDVETLLAQVKAAHPDMNLLVPASLNTGIMANLVSHSFDSFGVNCAGIDFSGDLTVKNVYATDEYMNICKMAKDWYDSGYILRDASTNTETRESHMKAGNTFGYIVGMKPGMDMQETTGCGYEMETITIEEPVLFTSAFSSIQWVLPRNCVDTKKAMQFYNLLYTEPAIQNYLIYGVEGKDYVVKDAEKGLIGYPDGKDVSSVGWAGQDWLTGNLSISYIWEGNSPTVHDDLQAFNNNAQRSPAFGLSYDSTGVSSEIAAISNIETKYRALLESGMVDPAEKIPEMIKELESAGIQNVIDDIQKQLDAFKGSNQ